MEVVDQIKAMRSWRDGELALYNMRNCEERPIVKVCKMNGPSKPPIGMPVERSTSDI